jgi:hypothetical protein
MTTALEQLERVAKRVGWKLHWATEPDVNHPTLAYRSLDIVQRGKPVLLDGPQWALVPEVHIERASESIAAVIMRALPSRGAR